ncbi:hypothetical protein PHET_09708 [Paragonimus heterotremus]|uniref:Tetratricopeptide repeat protein 7B n=1 Tax=Paragonimus heterotremus TaxID=100268 RepID=A0A8J4SH07_9TREM|nr:hypothetical protein PHET_09708 [Paragonimus heterotremus]
MQSFNNTSAVYDLMAIALTRTGCYSFLSKTLEKSLKFSYREFHIWYQFALSLISARKYYRAYMVLRECLRLKPTKLPIFFLTTSLCLGQLGLIEDGLELAYQAVEIATSQNDSIMCARAHLMLGWGCSLLARKCRIMDKKRQLQSQAISEYKKSTQLDLDDYLAWYHLSVELATQRQLDEALVACQNSLRLMPTHTNTLCLLALLHTAGGKRLDQASKVLRVGLADRPNDFSLLFLLAKVDTIRLNYKAGLLVYRRLLEVWRDMFAPESNTGFSNGLIGQSSASISPVPRSPSRSSSACTISPPLQIQAKIYHGLAEIYLENDQLNEAKDALDEALKITGLDIETLYLRGCLAEKQGLLTKARSIYESVIAIDSSHLAAHLSLADLLRQTNQAALAERVLRNAMDIDPTSCQVWHLLAEILALPSASEPASDTAVTKALFNAMDLEQTEPLEPFYQLHIGIQCH